MTKRKRESEKKMNLHFLRRFSAAFFLSVFKNDKQNKAAVKRRTPKKQNQKK